MKNTKRGIALILSLIISAQPILVHAEELTPKTQFESENVLEEFVSTELGDDYAQEVISKEKETPDNIDFTDEIDDGDAVDNEDFTVDMLGDQESVEELSDAGQCNDVGGFCDGTESNTVLLEGDADFSYKILNGTYCTLTGYNGNNIEVIIPAEIDGYIVQSISAGAFAYNPIIQKVVFPETIETIENGIFQNCSSLNYISLNNGLTNIANNTFEGCASLEGILLPETLETIASNAFRDCSGLTKIRIPDSVTGIEGRAFYNCKNLSKIELSPNWKTTNVSGSYSYESPFVGCSSLKEISLPSGMTKIPNYAFADWKELEKVNFHEKIVEIGNSVFEDCTGLKEAVLNGGLTRIGSSAFWGCSGLTGISLPEGLITVGRDAFANCGGLGKVNLPESLHQIEKGVFSGCTGLTEVVLPEALETITYDAFRDCSGLTKIRIPDSVTGIEGRAFYNCKNLSKIELSPNWRTTNVSGSYSYESPFVGCSSLKEISLPSGMTKIPNYAFADWKELEKVNFHEKIVEIGNSAFEDCTGLKEAVLNEGITRIGTNAFTNCSGLRKVNLPESLHQIERGVFSGCTGLTEVVLPEALETIAYDAFRDCSGLTKICIPDSVTGIEGRAFYNCKNLSKIELSSNWKTTNVSGSYSYESPFVGCSSLKEISLPSGMAKVPAYAFCNCTMLQRAIIADGTVEIENYAFSQCKNLKEAGIPNTVNKISGNVFEGCPSLVIHGSAGSYAEQYATEYKLPFSTESLNIEKVKISGRIIDGNGNGIENVAIAFYDEEKKNLDINRVYTDKEGCWVYEEALLNHIYSVYFEKTGYNIEGIRHWHVLEENKNTGDITAVEISGNIESKAEDFEYEALNGTYCTITGYVGNDSEVLLPSKINEYIVQRVSQNAFRDNKKIKKVFFPPTVTQIESGVFQNCTELEYAALNIGLSNIASNTFYGCEKLTKIVLPISLETIAYNAFCDCSGLTEICIPDSVTGIEGRAFYNCKNLSKIELSPNWKTTNVSGSYSYESPFVGCSSLKEISLPSGMAKIPNYAFADWKELEKVYLHEKIVEIGNSAFEDCTGLKEAVLNEGLTRIGSSAFGGCSGLTGISLPEGLITVGGDAFANCSGLGKVSLPESLHQIEKGVFSGCTGLTEVVLPEALETIAYNAFCGCSGLTKIRIPDSVTGIEGRVFYNCKNLGKIELSPNWKTTNVSGSYSYESPFVGCSSLKEISLPSGMTKIPDYAFADWKELEKVHFHEKIVEIGNSAFEDCTGLKEAVLNEGITRIGRDAFENCSGLGKVSLPESLHQIERGVFSLCTGLTEVVLPEALETIEYNAFCGCSGLTKIRIPDSVTGIEGQAFYNCENLSKIELSPNWKTTNVSGNYSYESPFVECAKLKEIIIPLGMKSIPDYAFKNCRKLKSVSCPETTAKVGRGAFENCTELQKVELISSNMEIAKDAFYNSVHLIVYTVEYSDVVKYCIENDVNFIIIKGDKGQDTGVLDRSKCSFEIEEQSIVNNTVKFKLLYSIKDMSALSDMTIEIMIPKMSELFANNILINGKICQDYEYDSSTDSLTVPIEAVQGEICFAVKVSAAMPITSYASLKYKKGKEKKSETLGVISSTEGMLSTIVNNRINEKRFKVSGIAPAGSDVHVYVDDELQTTVKATKLGVYETQLSLEEPKCFRTYEVKSEVILRDNSIITSAATTTYNNEAPKLKQFALYHGNKMFDLMELNNKRPTISFNPSSPMTFVVKFENGKRVRKVFITSTRNNEVKKIEALYDSNVDQYIASGWFDSENHSYVPGALSLTYTVDEVQYDYSPDTFFEDKENIESLPEEYKNADVEIIKNTDNEVSYRVELDTEEKIEYYQGYKTTNLSTPADDKYAETNGYYSVKDTSGTEYYVKNTNLTPQKSEQIFGKTKDAVKGHVISLVKKHDKELIELFYDENVAQAYGYLKENVYGPAKKYVGVLKTIGVAAQKESDLEDLKWKIRSDTSLTEKERQNREGLCDIAIFLNGLSCIGKVSAVAFTALGALTGPWGIALGIILGACDYVVDEYQKGLSGGNAFEKFYNAFAWLNWIIDPSGYVYEAVPDNYLEGVTATIYYKDSQTGESIVWDAEEYDQVNPMQTDLKGTYAWDVPEGLYQVKYEKEGYKTVYSDWLPVPPPQTDVNISMTSTKAPEVSIVVVNPQEVIIGFSQYMKAEAINSKTVTLKNNGVLIPYEVSPIKGKSVDGSQLAEMYKFTPASALSGEVSISCARSICNYADHTMEKEFVCVKTVEEKLIDISVEDMYTVLLESQGYIQVQATPKSAVKGKRIKVTASNEFILSLDSKIVEFDANGEAKIKYQSILPGQVELNLEVEGTPVNKKTYINCIMSSPECTEHQIVIDRAVVPTCILEGRTEGSHCAICNKVIVEQQIIPPTGHNLKTVVDKKATCGVAGKLHKECTLCGYKEKTTEIKPTNKHSYGAYVVTRAATVLSTGIRTRTCRVCKKKENATIAKLSPTVKLNATSITLKVKQYTSKIKVSGLAAGDRVKSWKSSNTRIVKVTRTGKIMAQKKTGKAIITVTLQSGKKANIKVKVQKGEVKTSRISGVPKKLSLKIKKKYKLKPIILPVTSVQKITYSSSNKKVATVSSKGIITAKKKGKAQIIIKSGKKKFTITITVK